MARQKYESMVEFHAYPKLIFAWPVIVIGPLLWLLGWIGVSQEILAWVFIVVSFIVVLAMGVDLERNHAFMWFLFLGMLSFLGMWLHERKIFTDLHILKFLRELDLAMDPKVSLIISAFLCVPYAVMYLWTRIQHKWRFSATEFEHISFGKQEFSISRGAKSIRCEYPDLFEMILCCAGSVVIYDAHGKHVLQRIENVPMLPFVKDRLDDILNGNRAMHDAAMDDLRSPSDDRFGHSAYNNSSLFEEEQA